MVLREGMLLGCGNPLLDISAKVDEKLLEKYDLAPDDAILAEEKHLPLYSELVDKCHATFTAGGSVKNSFRVAQWILQKPNLSIFFGCVGTDEYSKILENRSRLDGVNTCYQYDKELPTGTCAVLITGLNRSLCAHLGAAQRFNVSHLRIAENKRLIEGAEYFYISSFFLVVSMESIVEVASHALQYNKMFMMNLSAPYIAELYYDNLIKSLAYCDVIFGNEVEAKTFARKHNLPSTTIEEIALEMCKLPKHNKKRDRVVIITQGLSPVVLAQNGNVKEIPVTKLDSSLIVDTNCAGDAFVGGFLSQIIQQKSLETSISCGIWAAQHIIQRSGCTFDGIPDFSE